MKSVRRQRTALTLLYVGLKVEMHITREEHSEALCLDVTKQLLGSMQNGFSRESLGITSADYDSYAGTLVAISLSLRLKKVVRGSFRMSDNSGRVAMRALCCRQILLFDEQLRLCCCAREPVRHRGACVPKFP